MTPSNPEPCRPVFRFAPSPNGYLHLGHGLSAIIGWRMAKAYGGRFLLRIEDIDTGRCRQEYITAIFEDLEWLGLEWEQPVRRQSQHFDDYAEAIGRLEAMGLVYPCFASRSEITEAAAGEAAGCDPEGVPLYPGIWRAADADVVEVKLSAGDPHALRLDMTSAIQRVAATSGGKELTFRELNAPEGGWKLGNGVEALMRVVEARPERWGDLVVKRKDTPTSYNLSVVVDDALQGITHVCRGGDLFAATDVQRLLQVLLGLPEPEYHHHHLLLDMRGRKLSKSEASTSLRSLRADGWTAADVIARAGL